MNQNTEKYLPIGSVVLLKNGKKRLMITGYATIDMEKKDKIFDYCGCIFPCGIISTDQTLLFNHEDITKIFAVGYQDEEQKEYVNKIKENLTEENKKSILEKVQNDNIEKM